MHKKSVFIAIILIICMLCAYFLISPCSKEEAISIAIEYSENQYADIDLEKATIQVENLFFQKRWLVWFEEKSFNDEVVLGGGYPEIYISKNTGKVLEAYLQK